MIYNEDGLEKIKSVKFDCIISDPDYLNQPSVDIYRKYCSGNIIIFCDPRRRPVSSNRPDEVLVWLKTQSTKWTSKRFNIFFEEILVFKGRNPVFNAYHWSSLSGIFHDTFIDKPAHPFTKPISLMEKLVLAYSNPGDTIFDPFCGSGTTGLAAKMHGREFIGCELNKTYYDMAVARIA
jgi:DNA methylase